MRKFRSQVFFKYLVLVFLMVYLFGSFSNMFCIPRYSPISIITFTPPFFAFNKVVKNINYHTANFLQLIDKSVLNNDQLDATSFVPKCLLLIFFGFGLFKLKLRSTPRRSNVFYNLQYSYLSLCTLRI